MSLSTPILTLPLLVETRFGIQGSNELWIRAFPDDIFWGNFDRTLSPSEKSDALAFRQLETVETQRKYWESLVAKYGAYRASWLVQITKAELIQQASVNGSPQNSFAFKWLPERLFFYIYLRRKDNGKIELYRDGGGNIPSGEKIPSEGLPVFENTGNWIQNFGQAIHVGMGKKITFESAGVYDLSRIERIIVCGIRAGEDHSGDIAALFHNHQYEKGFSFVEYGTPTNNFEGRRSGYSSLDKYEAVESFGYCVEDGPAQNDQRAAGNTLARALGISGDHFKHIKGTDHQDPILNTFFQEATWFALGGEMLKSLFGDQIGKYTHVELWKHYSRYVKARGPLPAIKIGRQPYGILPAMAVRNSKLQTSDSLSAKLHPVLAALFDKWLEMVADNVPHVTRETADPDQELLRVLSMQEHSTALQLRVRKYDRISNRIPGWLQQELQIPTPLATLPLAQVYDLLQGRPEVAGMIESIKNNTEKLTFLLEHFGPEERLRYKEKLRNAPILSFKDDWQEIRSVYQLEDEPSKKEESESLLKLKLTQGNFQGLESVLQQLKKQVTPGAKESTATTRNHLLHYPDQTDLSLFVDLILRSYAGAAELGYRVICFEPTLQQLRDFKDFRVKLPGGILPDGVILTDGDRELTIKKPEGIGVIGKWFVTEGQQVQAGQRLFLFNTGFDLAGLNQITIPLWTAILRTLQQMPAGEQRQAQMTALMETLDLNSYRLDAWITSLATRRLDHIRNTAGQENKTLLGAYGWVENLRPNDTTVTKGANGKFHDSISKNDGGIIHCPTPAQARVATITKNAFLRHMNDQNAGPGNPFTLNLISDRIQKSNRLLDGIRQDQSVEALLGYHLERWLHDSGCHLEIYKLRKLFPLEVNTIRHQSADADTGFQQLSVIHGLKIIEARSSQTLSSREELNNLNMQRINDGIDQLEDMLDSSLDNLSFEAVYQLLNGNLDRSAAALEATMGKVDPPETEALKTRMPGTGIQHKLAILFPVAEDFLPTQAKAFVEPVLETWLKDRLGPMDKILCQVELYAGQEVYLKPGKVDPFQVIDVRLSDLAISYSDLFYLSDQPVSDGASELELRIRNYVAGNADLHLNWEQNTFKITHRAPLDCRSLLDALEWARYAQQLLARCRDLRSEDLAVPGEMPQYAPQALVDLAARLEQLLTALEQTDVDLSYLSQFDLPQAKSAFLHQSTPDSDRLSKEIRSKISQVRAILSQVGAMDLTTTYPKAFEELQRAAKLLFGSTFHLVPAAVATPEFLAEFQSGRQERLIGDSTMGLTMTCGQERVQLWMEELAQVKPAAAAFEEWLMIDTTWNATGFAYQIIQHPTGVQTPWIGLSHAEIDELRAKVKYPLSDDRYYPPGSSSMVLWRPDGLELTDAGKAIPCHGLIVEEFAEHIPDRELTTGLSFHYDTPNAEPPQTLLLAVKDQESGQSWTVDELAETINDTFDLMKVRPIDLEALRGFGFVAPFPGIHNIPYVN